VLALFGVSVLLAFGTFMRFYLVSWVGERVVADIRKAVFDHIIGLSPGFFEITRTGEVVSRLTTDTTLLQVVVGSSVSIALRNALLIIGGMVMLFVTSPKLTMLVLAVVPLVVAPIVLFGRKVRLLSRSARTASPMSAPRRARRSMASAPCRPSPMSRMTASALPSARKTRSGLR
jgi:ATP-binding cassette subfamily B protein